MSSSQLMENADAVRALAPEAEVARSRAIDGLAALQHDDGHWCGELEGDSILQSEYVLMKWILEQEVAPLADGRGPEVLVRIVETLRTQQRPDGGWGQFPGSDIDLSATVKGYFVLKLHGDDPEAPHMRRARERVRELGGAERVNTWTNFFLACLGQVSWNAVPAIPPEVVMLPRWFYFHLDKVAAWTRTMILPLSLVTTFRPARRLDASQGIDELFISPRDRHRLLMRTDVPAGWRTFFAGVDRGLKMLHRLGGSPWRRRAIDRSFEWIRRRAGQDGAAATDGVGAIFPPMVYWQVVLKTMGHAREHPLVSRAEAELDAFMLEAETEHGEPGAIRLQPCFSPVWDTGIALYALTDCGLDLDDPRCDRAARWLREKECRFQGDWVRNLDSAVPFSGWYFEYHNAWYPDVDDTAMVAMALYRTGGDSNVAAAKRGLAWMRSMQNQDGGWAAFDRTVDRPILEYIPFADHNAMQDPSCPDITGRVLECLSWMGLTKSDPTVRKAIDYVKRHQEPEGCWFGRWGVNYIYGTWQSVIGPIRCGEDPRQPWIQKAAAWLESVQKADGSFGETAMSYEDRSLMGSGPSTASQTAWAAMTLQEIRGADHPSVIRAIRWLCDTQLDADAAADPERNPDGDPAGSWCETEFTGTGFPKVFYLRYHLYRHSFPLMAIGRWLEARRG
ncbi:MAG: squalene--hopene cyclase [Phycisphaerae bacterium]|nr:squalene--hopene cyclase [Phycisphaerae bacterium]